MAYLPLKHKYLLLVVLDRFWDITVLCISSPQIYAQEYNPKLGKRYVRNYYNNWHELYQLKLC